MKKRSLITAAIFVCGALLFTGCSSVSEIIQGAAGGSSSSTAPGASVLDDGREVGGYVDGRIGDTLTNAFFSYTVNDAYLADTFADESPAAGNTFLVSEITVKNVRGKQLDMWAEDFQIQWGDTAAEYGYPILKFDDSQMDDQYVLKKGESITKLCVFQVPTPTKETEYSISYLEFYEDQVQGNVFFIYFDLAPTDKI